MQLQIDESNLLFNCPIKNKVIKEEENEEEEKKVEVGDVGGDVGTRHAGVGGYAGTAAGRRPRKRARERGLAGKLGNCCSKSR